MAKRSAVGATKRAAPRRVAATRAASPVAAPAMARAVSSVPSIAKAAPAASRIAAALPTIKTVARAAGRGSLAAMAVNTVLSAGVGAYRDGLRGAGRGVVEGLTFGLGTAAYDHKLGQKHPPQLFPDENDMMRGLTDRNVARTTLSVGAAYGANMLKVSPVVRNLTLGYSVLSAAADAATTSAAAEAVREMKKSGQTMPLALPATGGGIVRSLVGKAQAAPSGKPRGFANPEIRKAAQAAKNAKSPPRGPTRRAPGKAKSTSKGKRR